MSEIIIALKNRRVWAGIVGVVGFIACMFGVEIPDQALLIEVFTEVGTAIALLITGVLPLWSYIEPRKTK